MDKQRSFFMKKIKSSLDKKLLVTFIIKSVFFSALFCAVFSAIISAAFYKLDISFESSEYFSAAVMVISAALTGFICSSSFKNSGFLVGAVSSLPLILFSFINLIVNHNTVWLFFVKFALAIIFSGLAGIYSVKKSKKIRVKK